ncbi:transposase [Oceanisphaera avium]|uniref:Transposase n=1 Tax=Oceanisphaera avium TaxID=1903694 RepID=A0A1Y0CXW5_9GAMM|nr:transposase [Oceanisphaera avium]ART79685.1 transposase [Oceanisphaera avium]
MPKPRFTQISLAETPYYHCVSRTVRRAFLCGHDHFSGQSYEHRRNWIEERLLLLAQIFAIDLAAYAVMSNHLHVVLKVDIEKARAWTDSEVVAQWHLLFAGTWLTQRFARGEVIEPHFIRILDERIAEYRQRLTSISWFMRALNEPIARQANKEDNCTGRFWEGRFKSQALLDDAAVLACMTYVDLNPIRAKLADTPEQSDFTSIQRRIDAAKQGQQPKELLPFMGNEYNERPKGLILELQDYFTLVDDTGRILRGDKGGTISETSAKILERLNIPQENWLKITQEFMMLFKGPVGTLPDLKRHCEQRGMRRVAHASSCQHWAS